MPYEYRLIDLVSAVNALQRQLELSGYTLREAALFPVTLFPANGMDSIHMQVVIPRK